MAAIIYTIFLMFIIVPPEQDGVNKYLLKGKRLIEEGNYRKAVKSLKHAVNIDRKNPDTHFYLGEAYCLLGGLQSRLKAADAYDSALRLDPNNKKYLFRFAELRWKQGFVWNAEQMFLKILHIDSSYTKASIELARMYEENALWFKEMVVRGTPIKMRKFYEKKRDEAEKVLKKAMVLDEKDDELYLTLGLIYLNEKKWPEMTSLFEKAIELNPDNMDAHLFLAYTFFRTGDINSALQEYDIARSLMDGEERFIMDSYENLISPKEEKDYASLAGQYSDSSLVFQYWNRNDPSFLTKYNERQLEHYSRFAYVNLRFGNPRKGRIGWKTERGQVYLRYGEPLHITRTRPEMETRLNPSVETWVYQDFSFQFEDRYLSRDFSLMNFSKQMYDEIKAHTPEVSNTRLDEIKVNFSKACATFKGDSGKTVIEFYYTIPYKNGVEFDPDREFWYTVDEGCFLFTEDWIPAAENLKKGRIKYIPEEKNRQYPPVGYNSINIRPGFYNFGIEFRDTFETFFGNYRDTVVVSDYSSSNIQISDIVIGKEMPENKVKYERFEENWFVPQPELIFRPDEKLYLFYEIYNLYYNSSGKTSFKITTEVQQISRQESVSGKIKNVFKEITGSRPEKPVISNTFRQEGNTANDKSFYGLDISVLEAGKYRILCKIEDLVNNKHVSKYNTITIKQ